MDIDGGFIRTPRGGIILFGGGAEDVEGVKWIDTNDTKWADTEDTKWWRIPEPEPIKARILIF